MKPTFFVPLQDPNDEMPDLLPDEDDIDLVDGEGEDPDA